MIDNRNYQVLLFDLGGIFIELTGVDRMLEWTGNSISVETLWEKWLLSPSVRKFESGKSSPDSFASEIIDEFSLPVGKEQFLREFVSWSTNTHPDSKILLNTLSRNYTTASLSNTNELHWSGISSQSGLSSLFNYNFPSHLTGMLKPDKTTYYNVIDELGCKPEEVLFLDDNQLNVDSAGEVGVNAVKVEGFSEMCLKLCELGVIGKSELIEKSIKID